MAKGTVNKAIILGRLGADPEVRYMPDGKAITKLSVATNDGYKDKNTGEFVTNTEWHRVTLFARLAEIAGQYLKKGGSVFIEGRIQTTKWQDRDGQDRYSTEIVGNNMQLLSDAGNQNNAAWQPPAHHMESSQIASQGNKPHLASEDIAAGKGAATSANKPTPPIPPIDDDEIPF